MNPYQQQSSLRQVKEENGRHHNAAGTNEAAMLSDAFNHLSLATGSAPSLPDNVPSPRTVERDQFNSRHATPSRVASKQPPGLRKAPSSTSLRDDRRASTPSLQKKLSTSSLRSSHNVSTPPLSRRASSNHLSSPTTNMGPKSPLNPPSNGSTQKAAPTAASIASDHFKKELELHRSVDTGSKTVIIIHDACYGHRFSRPRTSKAALSTIVERPERIQASILGISTAFVRMGQRHEGGRFAPHPDLDVKLLPTPPFQIRKTDRSMPINSPAVTHVHGAKWMEELKTMCHAAEDRLALNGKELVRPRSSGKDENGANSQKLHEGDLYLCPESLNAFEGALGGVCDAVDSVFGVGSTRRAFVCVRPPGHHCSANDPSGFCWLNNVHVGITHGAMNHGLTHAAILDFDCTMAMVLRQLPGNRIGRHLLRRMLLITRKPPLDTLVCMTSTPILVRWAMRLRFAMRAFALTTHMASLSGMSISSLGKPLRNSGSCTMGSTLSCCKRHVNFYSITHNAYSIPQMGLSHVLQFSCLLDLTQANGRVLVCRDIK